MKRQQQQNLSQSRDGGYTIIESLVAMIVVSVLMIAIAPVMAFSVATRVQARRMELATQAARAYIDALRPRTATDAVIKLGGSIKGFPISITTDDLADAPTPRTADPNNNDNLYCVDMDGGGCDRSSNKDFYVQGAWKNQNVPVGGDPTSKGYQLLVRVYRADSFPSVTLRNPKNTPKQSVVGSGLGDKTMPVVEMSTEIPATGTPSRQSIFDRLNKKP